MTHDEQMKRLSELGWTATRARIQGHRWGWHGLDNARITMGKIWIEPVPIPDELLALLEPEEPKQAHTKGPWEVEKTGRFPETNWDNQVRGGDGMRVALVEGFGNTPDANARLIAAAPELLEIARDACGHWHDWTGLLGERANALIARIEGETDEVS